MNKYSCTWWRRVGGHWRQSRFHVVSTDEHSALDQDLRLFSLEDLKPPPEEIIVRYVSTCGG